MNIVATVLIIVIIAHFALFFNAKPRRHLRRLLQGLFIIAVGGGLLGLGILLRVAIHSSGLTEWTWLSYSLLYSPVVIWPLSLFTHHFSKPHAAHS
ncbi:MAG: hypothetical protein H0W44_03520 [Gammaproteobacteria bacterium]|nr:hypothetical protein [Gammaproteobacteria bacterium]